eukprot:6481300-Amphidinium_carterae.1
MVCAFPCHEHLVACGSTTLFPTQQFSFLASHWTICALYSFFRPLLVLVICWVALVDQHMNEPSIVFHNMSHAGHGHTPVDYLVSDIHELVPKASMLRRYPLTDLQPEGHENYTAIALPCALGEESVASRTRCWCKPLQDGDLEGIWVAGTDCASPISACLLKLTWTDQSFLPLAALVLVCVLMCRLLAGTVVRVADSARCIWLRTRDLFGTRSTCKGTATNEDRHDMNGRGIHVMPTQIRRSTAHIKLETKRIRGKMSRAENWRVRRVVCSTTTRATIAAWRKSRMAIKQARAEECRQAKRADQASKGSRVLKAVDARSLAQRLKVELQNSEFLECKGDHRQPQYVSGDGNCMWRSLWIATQQHDTWKQLKKSVLGLDKSLAVYRPWAIHADASCVAAASCVLNRVVHVRMGSRVISFTPQSVLAPPVELLIEHGHAQPISDNTAQGTRRARSTRQSCVSVKCDCNACPGSEHGRQHLSRNNVDMGFDLTSLACGGVRKAKPVMNVLNTESTRISKRRKRTRYHVCVDDLPTIPVFVDEHLQPSIAARHIALHHGACPTSATVGKIEGIMTVHCWKVRMHASVAKRVSKLIDIVPLKGTMRDNGLETREAFLGHRATRLRGILKGTEGVRPKVLGRALKGLSAILSGFKFSSLGIVSHGSVDEHVDSTTTDLSAVYTWGGR